MAILRDTNCGECLAWVRTYRRESTREESAFVVMKIQGAYRSEGGGEEPAM